MFVDNYPHEPRNLGEKIRKYRIDSGLQIKDLAKLIGFTSDTIISWERGRAKSIQPNFDIIQRILNYFNITEIYPLLLSISSTSFPVYQ